MERLVEVSQVTKRGQGISGRENSPDKGPEKGGEYLRKLRPGPLELGPLAHLVLIKYLPNCRSSPQKDGARDTVTL